MLLYPLRKIIFSSALCLFLSACATAPPAPEVKPLTAERPKEEAFRTTLKREISSLNVPIELTSDELAKKLNQMIGTEIYKGSTRTSGVSISVVKNGPLAVSAADNYLYLTLPVSLSMSYGFFKPPAVASKLKFRLGIQVTPDWKVNTDIFYLGLSDLMAEEIGIGPLTIKPRSLVDGITQPVQKIVSERISARINEAFPLRTEIAKAWRAAQKPVLIDKNYGAWLKIAPQEVMLYPIYLNNNRVKVSVGIKSFAEVVMGSEPAAQPALPLPNLKLVGGFDRNFRVALHADLPYRELLNIAGPLLLNKDYGTDGKSIILKEMDIYGNGDKLVVKVATSGSVEGVFYLTGKPVVNPATRKFSVDEVDFDMQSQDLLIKSANWFLHGTIRDALHDKLNMDLSQRLEQSRTMAQQALARINLVENVYLKGNVKEIRINDVMVQKDKISIQVYTEGDTALFLK